MATREWQATEIPAIPPAQPHRPQWRSAWRALRALMREPDDTRNAIEFYHAVGDSHFERSFQRFVASPIGKQLLLERPDLGKALADREALAAMPPGSLGRAYLELMTRSGLEPTGLVELEDRVGAQREEHLDELRPDPLRKWYLDRFVLLHDLFHVLSGYGTDELGEAALLAFTTAQHGGRANRILALGVSLQALRALGPRWLPYVHRAYRRGRRAAWLPALPFEELLELPLATVRRIAELESIEAGHPGGLLQGGWSQATPARSNKRASEVRQAPK